ncbi:hypothetical protein C1I59_17305 [Paenibacillus polymyxa]|jgi:hypothetical protein|nr:hypothetical protein C1I59_17305 [Paenibacillus polymyxa]
MSPSIATNTLKKMLPFILFILAHSSVKDSLYAEVYGAYQNATAYRRINLRLNGFNFAYKTAASLQTVKNGLHSMAQWASLIIESLFRCEMNYIGLFIADWMEGLHFLACYYDI